VTTAIVCQVGGLACLIGATWLWHPLVGLAVLGAALLLVGIVQERTGL
jgi:hypothetical protein